MKSTLLLAMLAVLAPAVLADELVPFVIPFTLSKDSLIVLPACPEIKTDSPRLAARDGHFYAGDRRVRIWGVNFCFGSSFPSHANAEKLAARLAAFGVNSVRFHHLDNMPFPDGILEKDMKTLAPEALDRLDYFLDQLARRGIYANLNLHVSRTYTKVINLPAGTQTYDKIVNIFTPQLVQAQRQYARDLLTHVNAYRKVRYADDPAVGFVEINNEDSLFMWGADQTLRSLPEFYAKLLRQAHIAWLKGKYGSTEKLKAAWDKDAVPLGESLIVGVSRHQADRGKQAWRLEQHEGCTAQVRDEPRKPLAGANPPEAVYIDITKSDSTGWHLQYNVAPVRLEKGKYYTLIFKAKAGKARSMTYALGMDHPPHLELGLRAQAKLTGQWQEVQAGFFASADDDNARVSFELGGSDVPVELEGVRLCTGGMEGLRQGESIESGSVALLAGQETKARVIDRMKFLAETEKAYFDGMREFIKKDLGVKALVTGTIVFGPLGLYGQSDMDYIDGHAYWEHPHFPGRDWDPVNWLVEQKAMVDHPDQSPLFGLACQRLAGKPYTVSEYSHPAPNDYQAECVPMIASFAAAQDWDGVWLFAYSHDRDGYWDKQAFANFWDIDANPAKWGFMPAGAMIFREGSVPAPAERVFHRLGGLADLAGLHPRSDRNMASAAGLTWRDFPERWPTAMTLEEGLLPRNVPPTKDSTSGECELHWRVAKDRAYFTAAGQRALAHVEHLPAAFELEQPVLLGGTPQNKSAWADGAKVTSPKFAATTVTALDAPQVQVTRFLITACGRCENTGMKFSADRRTVGRDWGGPPVRIEPVDAIVPIPDFDAGQWKCQALGPDGRPTAEVKLDPAIKGVHIEPRYQTMWYLLTRK